MCIRDRLYRDSIEPHIRPGASLAFAHGFAVHYQQIQARADIDVILAAPKGIGDMVREQYQAGRGVAFLIAVAQDASGQAKARALAYAVANGAHHSGIFETSFKDETETDLFGEQAVLCGGVIDLALAGYETLVEAGYPAEMAYFECLHELKLVVDLLHRKGVAGMRESISNTAEYGGYQVGSALIDASVKARMRTVLEQIQQGEFAQRFIAETAAGFPSMNADRKRSVSHPVEAVGADLRAKMPWI